MKKRFGVRSRLVFTFSSSLLIFVLFLLFILGVPSVFADGTCSGTVHACNSHNGDQSGCTSVGCSYNQNNNKCSGTHDACSTFSSQATCQSHSCTWAETPPPPDPGSNATISITTSGMGSGSTPPPIKIVFKSPADEASLRRGSFDLVVQGFEGIYPSSQIRVNAFSSLFGEVTLEPDFQNRGVGFYGATINLKEGTAAEVYEIIVRGELSSFDEERIRVHVNPTLEITTSIKERFQKGEHLMLDGKVSYFDKEIASGIPISLSIISGHEIFTKVINTSSLGFFSFDFPISFAEPSGVWRVELNAYDKLGNIGQRVLNTTVVTPPKVAYYDVRFLSPVEHTEFVRGEIIPITVEVREGKDLVSGLDVHFHNLHNEKILLKEVALGTYSVGYQTKYDGKLGNWHLAVEALHQSREGIYKAGGNHLALTLRPAQINAVLVRPTKTDFFTGQEVEFAVEAHYSSGAPLEKGVVFVALGPRIIKLGEVGLGLYSSTIVLNPDDALCAELEVSVQDIYNNRLELSHVPVNIILVNKYELKLRLFYYNVFSRYWYFFAGGLVLLLIISYPTWHRLLLRVHLKRILNHEQRIIETQKDLQWKYFKHHVISRDDYEKLMLELREKMSTYHEKKLELLDKIGEKNLSRKSFKKIKLPKRQFK
ncbi:hypothetical protein HYV86_02470 [Candidatus Woesearchaeota archaeon]|nr:hypothetical protein [Candidatus Woesearchaeota archaeon]